MSEIFMIRHGQASFGENNYDRLSDRGKEQCRVLAEHLYNAGIEFHQVYSGYLERQKETAAIITGYYAEKKLFMPDSSIKEGFNEYNSSDIIKSYLPGMVEDDPSFSEAMQSFFTDKKSFKKIFQAAIDRWIHDENPPGNVESRPAFKERVSSALSEIMRESGKSRNILVSASGGSITAAVQFVLGISDKETITLGGEMANASITRFRFSGNRITLHGFNCYSHLMDKNRELVTFR